MPESQGLHTRISDGPGDGKGKGRFAQAVVVL